MRFLGLPTSVRATRETTNGAFGLVESWSMPPGFTSPYHLHHMEKLMAVAAKYKIDILGPLPEGGNF